MPRSENAVAWIAVPFAIVVWPGAGTIRVSCGGGVVGVPGPNRSSSIVCEFWVLLHLQLRTLDSPHWARLLRKNFSPPQSVRSFIGSLQALVPSVNWYS